jgi:hypothetical protein
MRTILLSLTVLAGLSALAVPPAGAVMPIPRQPQASGVSKVYYYRGRYYPYYWNHRYYKHRYWRHGRYYYY